MNPTPEAIANAVLLFAVIAAYALFAGADFGGGIWDLLAGGTRRGAEVREAITDSVTPVWEGNHVWIIYGLVIVWTAFPAAFGAIMTALFVPLALSLLGILLRGVGFAFRHEAERLPMRQLSGSLFAVSSVITPFFLGAVVGAVATGRVPVAPSGNVFGAWTTPTAILTGVLFVSTCAYISAIYLVGDCERRGEHEIASYFSRRSVVAGLVTGVLAAVNLVLMNNSARYVYPRLVGVALPLVLLSAAAGIAALVLIVLGRSTLVRIAAAIAVASVVGAWGWAQYPWLLPTTLSLRAGSAPSASLWAELVVACLAVLLVAPSFVLLYWLQQHGHLRHGESTRSLRLAAGQPVEPRPVSVPRGPSYRVVVAVVFAGAAGELLRDLFRRRRDHGRR